MVLHGPAQPQQVRIPFPCVVDAVEAAVVQLVEEVEGELEALPEGVGVPYGGGGVRRWATRPQGPGDALGQCSAPVDEPGPVARSGADSGGGALTRPCRQVGRGVSRPARVGGGPARRGGGASVTGTGPESPPALPTARPRPPGPAAPAGPAAQAVRPPRHGRPCRHLRRQALSGRPSDGLVRPAQTGVPLSRAPPGCRRRGTPPQIRSMTVRLSGTASQARCGPRDGSRQLGAGAYGGFDTTRS